MIAFYLHYLRYNLVLQKNFNVIYLISANAYFVQGMNPYIQNQNITTIAHLVRCRMVKIYMCVIIHLVVKVVKAI